MRATPRFPMPQWDPVNNDCMRSVKRCKRVVIVQLEETKEEGWLALGELLMDISYFTISSKDCSLPKSCSWCTVFLWHLPQWLVIALTARHDGWRRKYGIFVTLCIPMRFVCLFPFTSFVLISFPPPPLLQPALTCQWDVPTLP